MKNNNKNRREQRRIAAINRETDRAQRTPTEQINLISKRTGISPGWLRNQSKEVARLMEAE